MQSTNTILMVKPSGFRFNEETALNNHFQMADESQTVTQIQHNAVNEFQSMVSMLQKNGIEVIVIDHENGAENPDAVFPNNWFSTHQNGDVYLYPMNAINRRLERRLEIFDTIKEKYNLRVSNIIDFTHGEKKNLFLEGTGSMILDRVNCIIYASLSKRTSKKLLSEYAKRMNYDVISFKSYHSSSNQSPLIYHTNVMMCLASSFTVICLESILDQNERQRVIDKLKETEKIIIEITFDQMNNFAGNMLEVQNSNGDLFLVMSSKAYHSLNKNQINQIQQYVQILHSPIDTIEILGGGSARCMMAEIFLPNQD